MANNQLSKYGSDGTTMGQAPADKIGFYGAVPIAQQVLPAGATVAQVVTFLNNLGLGRPT